MAPVRFSALYRHEWQYRECLPFLTEMETEGWVITGSVDSADVDRLRSLGLRVQLVSWDEEPLRPSGVYLPNRLLDDFSVPDEDGGDSGVHIVRFFGPPLTRWKRELEEVGAVVLEHLRSQDYTVRVRRGAESRLREFRFIAGWRLYSIRDTVLTPLAWTEDGSYVSAADTVFEILLHPGGDYERIDHFLGRLGAEVVDRSIRLLSFRWPDSIPSIESLLRVAAQPDVALLDVRREARPTCDRARRLIGADVTPTVNPAGLTGNGQTIAFADTGFDDLHADLNGRILSLIPRGRQYDPSDPTGHGTHVASVAAGTGAASGAAGIVGVAPEASLVLQSVMDADNTMSGLYQPDLASLFDEAYAHGARIMNNSWGIPNDSRYRPKASAVDQWAVDHPDMLLVFSAGNGGTAAFNRNSPVGFVDLLSVDDPATAKNVLTVGASRSDRVGDPPEASARWRQRNPRAFGDPPIADEIGGRRPSCVGRGQFPRAVRRGLPGQTGRCRTWHADPCRPRVHCSGQILRCRALDVARLRLPQRNQRGRRVRHGLRGSGARIPDGGRGSPSQRGAAQGHSGQRNRMADRLRTRSHGTLQRRTIIRASGGSTCAEVCPTAQNPP